MIVKIVQTKKNVSITKKKRTNSVWKEYKVLFSGNTQYAGEIGRGLHRNLVVVVVFVVVVAVSDDDDDVDDDHNFSFGAIAEIRNQTNRTALS